MNKKIRIIIGRSLVVTALISLCSEFSNGRMISVNASEISNEANINTNEKNKEDYAKKKFLDAINKLENKVSFNKNELVDYGLNKEYIKKIYKDFLFEHAELFYIADTNFDGLTEESSDELDIYIAYIYDKDEITSKKEEFDKKVTQILNGVSYYDKLRKTYEIYDYLRENNDYSKEYDYKEIDYSRCNSVHEILLEIKSNKSYFEAHSVYGTFVNEKSVWSGYSRALKMLLEKSEIKNGIIRNGDYGWNYVYMNEKYYHMSFNYDEDYSKYSSNPYKYFNFSDKYYYLDNNLGGNAGFECYDTTFDNIFRGSNNSEAISKNIVRIGNKLYDLDSEYKLYTYNLDGSNKKYICSLKQNRNSIVKNMKQYKNYLYFMCVEYKDSNKYTIKRYNINTSKFEEVLNLSDKLKLKSDDEASINIMDFYIKDNVINVYHKEKDRNYKFNLNNLNIKDDSENNPSNDSTNDNKDDGSWPTDKEDYFSNRVVINNKLYFLDDKYKLYSSNINGSNKRYLYDFNINDKTIIRCMKNYSVYIYFISYEYVNGKYVCLIKRYNTISEILEEVINVGEVYDVSIKYEYINSIKFNVENNKININYIGKSYTYDLSKFSGDSDIAVINNKLYYLTDEYKLYWSNRDGSNKTYVCDLTSNNKNAIIKYLKSYDNDLYYIFYEYINDKYIGVIKKYDIKTGTVHEVINLNKILGMDIKEEHIPIIYFYIRNKVLYVDFMNNIKTYDLIDLIEEKNEDLYEEALQCVKIFEKKLTSSTYRKAKNKVAELLDSDKKDKLLRRIKNAKKDMREKYEDEYEDDEEKQEGIEINKIAIFNNTVSPSGIQLNDTLSPWQVAANSSYNHLNLNNVTYTYNPALPGQWIFRDGNWYHIDNNLRFTTGWLKYNDSMYYFDNNGAMAVGWRSIGNDMYYFDDNGTMRTGWLKDNSTGKWYYLQDDGTMVRGTIKCGYSFGNDGSWIG